MKLKKVAIPPLLVRLAAFLLLAVLITGVIGPRIISSGILYRDGFAIYGGAGKALAFALVAFALLARNKVSTVVLEKWNIRLLGWMGLSVLTTIGALFMVGQLIDDNNSLLNILVTHTLMILSIVFAALAVFGVANSKRLLMTFRKEIVVSLAIAGIFYVFLTVVYSLWKYLAYLVLHAVAWLLDISGLTVTVVPEFTILLDKFGVTVEKYCSGIESIALFSGLYAIVGILDWHKLNKKRYFLVFPIALGILFLLNILRVYILILAGYHINIELAFSLFHSYAGMIFFMVYAGLFWMVMYKHLLTSPSTKKSTKATGETAQ